MRFYCLLFSLLLSMALSAQTTYYVSTTGNAVNDGLSWATAKRFIKHAITVAQDGDIIKVAQGTYVDGGTTEVTKSVTIKGGYDPATDMQDYTKPSELKRMNDTGRIMNFTATGKVLNLDNLSFVSASSTRGAALNAQFSGVQTTAALNVTHCTFKNNKATGDLGAAIMAMYVPVKLSHCIFSGNENKVSGSVYVKYGIAEVTNCLFNNNTSEKNSPALYYHGTSLQIVSSTFADNSTPNAQGGALGLYSDANVASNVEISNSIFWENVSATNAQQIFVSTDVQLLLTSNIIQGGRSDIIVGARSVVNYASSMSVDATDTNPLFIDASAADYRLKHISAAVNAGSNDKASAILSDLNGKERMQGVNIDLGAYETTIFEVDGIDYIVSSDNPADVWLYDGTGVAGNVTVPTTVSYGESVYNVTGIAARAFNGNTALNRIDIPVSVADIKESAFEGCTQLAAIVCRIATPQSFMTNAFNNTNATIYVPAVSVAAYDAEFDNVGAFVDMKKEYVTFCSTGSISFTGNTGVKAFIASSYDETSQKISLQEVSSLPHSTGAILHAEPDIYLFATTATHAPVAVNLLKGVTVDTAISETEGDKTNYLLSNGEFGKANAGILAAGKAYLQLPTSQAGAKHIGMIEEETTGVDLVVSHNVTDNVYYTLGGIRIAKPAQKGVYINNGRKVIVK